MYHLHTAKQLKYFDEVIRLHYEEGYGEDRIEQVLPVSHSTASRWIAIFAREKGNVAIPPRRVYEKEKVISLQLRCCLFASKQRLLFESPALFEGVSIIRMGVNIVRMHTR